MDLSKLNDEQIEVALKVIESSKKHGINPDFVLPMVYQESSFNLNAKSPVGAIGPMQLMPRTAKELGVDPHDVDQNIDGGIRYIKGLIENKNLGGDPRNILAAYNAGPNAKFFSTGDLKDLPDETINHVIKITGAYGGEVPSMTITPADTETTVTRDATDQSGGLTDLPRENAAEPTGQLSGNNYDPEDQYSGETVWDVQNKNKQAIQEKQNQSAKEMGAMGAALGASAGSIYAAKAPAIRMAQRVGLLPGGKPISPAEAAALTERVMSPNTTPTSESIVRKTHGGENWQKALTGISTPNAQMDKSSLDLAKRMQSAIGIEGAQGFTGGTITPGGIILGPQDAAAVQIKQQAAAAKAAQAEALLQQQAQKALNQQSANNLIKSVSRTAPVTGALAGAGVGFNAQDAYNKFQQGDTLGGTLSSSAAGASGLSLIPKLARFMNPAAIGLTTASQVAGDLNRGDKQGAATSGLSGLAAFFPYIAAKLAPALYSRGLNPNEDEIMRKIHGEQ